MEVIPVTKREIINIICSLKSKKSSGYDGILSKILKTLYHVYKWAPFLYLQHVYCDWYISWSFEVCGHKAFL
jgi:hypothetical protein